MPKARVHHDAGAPPPRPARQPYSLHVARTLLDIVKLQADWRQLETRASGATLFQTYDWCRNCAEHDVLHGEQDFFVCAVYSGPDLVGVLPLRRQKKAFRSVLSGLGEPFQQYSEMLLAEGHDPQKIFRTMVDVFASSGADFVYLSHVRADGPLSKAVDGVMMPTREEKAAPAVALSAWPDFEGYFKSINPKTRKNMRNLRNKLERMGTLSHEISYEGAALAEVIADTFEGRTEWLERTGLTSRAFRNAGFESFVDRFKAGAESGLQPVAMRLKLDGRPIAQQWGFIHRGRYYAFISTWDTAFQEFSPGRLHLEEVLRACSAAGVQTVDFLVPASAYKLLYAPEVTQVRDYVLPLTLAGQIYSGLWLRILRPLAKRLAFALPANWRKHLIGGGRKSAPA